MVALSLHPHLRRAGRTPWALCAVRLVPEFSVQPLTKHRHQERFANFLLQVITTPGDMAHPVMATPTPQGLLGVVLGTMDTAISVLLVFYQ